LDSFLLVLKQFPKDYVNKVTIHYVLGTLLLD